nr:glycosyltransferase family 2 protein [Clostridium caldaquaticum]
MYYSIVIPMYNSGDWIQELTSKITDVLKITNKKFEIILVNDCSPDLTTWDKIVETCKVNKNVKGINLMRNTGQYRATIAGLDRAMGKYVVTMDDDFQHKPEELIKLINAIEKDNKYDCVFGIYGERKDSFIRKIGSKAFNKLNEKIYKRPKGIKISSFRIMKRDIAKALVMYKTTKPQVGPLILKITNKVGNVIVEHQERIYGKSGYKLSKLISETIMSIINVSTLPLDIMSWLGFLSSFFSAVVGVIYLILYLLGRAKVPGFTTLILSTTFFSGSILFSIGILGKYIGRIINELTGLPNYIIKEEIDGDKNLK